MFVKKNIFILLFFLLSNLSLFFFFEINTILVIYFFEILTVFTFFKLYRQNKIENNGIDQSDTHPKNSEEEILLNFLNQFSFPVFILNENFVISHQNVDAKENFGANDNKDIISVIRDYDFISQFEKYKKNNNYNNFNWNKPLPDNQYFKTEIFKVSKFYIITIVDITFDKLKDEQYSENLMSLTHELKTPLSVIIGYLETINLNNLSNKENQNYLDIINAKTFQIRDLIDQTLKLAEIESLSIQKISNDLHSLLEKSLDNYSILFKKKGIQLHIDILASREIFFDFTPNDFDFVLNNLLSNALKYTPAGKNVYVTAKTQDNKTSIIIKDEGIGISQTDLNKITTKFFRADQSRNSETGGHGLGLAIVDKLLSKNGHKLEFSSVLGEGSTFKIDLLLS
ncbi:histidine kinase [alpha proteobacterium HIMB59]|nr:histidine kinase [alpha proteobacterium HIMB59]